MKDLIGFMIVKVMVDKPGCTTLDQLNNLKKTVKETGKIWSVNFSERFHVAAVTKAEELVNEGKIGKVKQTIGTGPHRQGNYERPDWFYNRQSYGGIITCLLYTSPSPRDKRQSRMPSSA